LINRYPDCHRPLWRSKLSSSSRAVQEPKRQT
jgi:hypothetical protein